MNILLATLSMVLSTPPEYKPAIHHAHALTPYASVYVQPLAYGKQDKTFIPAFDDPATYDEIRFQAINNCKNARNKKIDIKIIDKLIAIEKQYDVPLKLRGMLLAAACSESGYDPQALGDWRTINRRGKKRRVAKAVGLFQMWPWWTKKNPGYGVDRNNVEQTAHAFMKHIKKQLTKIKCKYRSPHRKWVAAWVTAIRAPKVGGRCAERPLHLRHLRRWHRNIKKQRIEIVPGC